MSKLARYGGPRGFDFDTAWCKSSDVEKLEASHAELLVAAKEVVKWWYDDDSVGGPSVWGMMDRLRAAIAKAKGEVMP